MKNKPKLTYEQLVDEKIRGKGITTDNYSDEEIIQIFENKNYYYRIASYRKNFSKNKEKKYIGLDFKALVDMASIDSYLREYILSLSLDVEHGAKTDLMRYITNDPYEDGYTILKEFRTFRDENESFYKKTVNKLGRNTYLKDMNRKRGKKIPVWVFLELVDFGTFIKFINFYHHKKNNQTIKTYDRTLKFVKNLRNATAHNNVFLINIFDRTAKMKYNISEVNTYAKLIGLNREQSQYSKINDLICLFYLHKEFLSDRLNKRRFEEGQRLISRMSKNISLHKSSDDYMRLYRILIKLVDFLK